MTLSIKNGRYAFLTRLDLMFSISLWKEFRLLQILNKQLAVVLAILAKLVIILKLEFRNISKRITRLIFLNIYTPM